ncbi:glycosyltransferase [Candidatus Daviesbacteria bacterium]|nr:glycosyltransferase [Candidatus Daviesbacteria bacterium]
MTPKVSVIVPSYNEAADLKRQAINQIDGYLKIQKYPYEVLIVDDGSTNNTVSVVEKEIKNKKNFKLIKNPHGGKAITVMIGMLVSKGDIALFTDMDQATPIYEIEKLLPKFDSGFDIVIGSRHGRKGASLSRKLAAWGFASLRNIILNLPLSDTQCGFKLFNRKSINLIFPKLLNDWQAMKQEGAAVNAGFDAEVLFIAKKQKLKIAEVNVLWHHVQNEKQVQIIKDGIEAIKDMVRIRLSDAMGKYGG